jgi:hypothetical protein
MMNVMETLTRLSEEYEDREFRFGVGIVENGPDDATIWAAANWNGVPTEVVDQLEAAGVSIKWCDEIYECDGCQKAVRCEPDSYGWVPSYLMVNECKIICIHCITPDDLTEYINDSGKALAHHTYRDLLMRDGWDWDTETYRHGLHRGMGDNPADVFAKARKFDDGDKDYLFTCAPSQFYVEFWLWSRPKEEEELETWSES